MGPGDIELMPRSEEDTVTRCGRRVPDSLLHPRARPSTAVAFLLAPALPPSPPWFFVFAPFVVFRSHVPDILSLNSPEEFSSLSIYVGRGLGSLTGGSLFYSC